MNQTKILQTVISHLIFTSMEQSNGSFVIPIIRLQNKVVTIINDVPLQDSITPHYVN